MGSRDSTQTGPWPFWSPPSLLVAPSHTPCSCVPWGPDLCQRPVNIKHFKSLLPTCCLTATLLPHTRRTSPALSFSQLACICDGADHSHQFQRGIRRRARPSAPLSEFRRVKFFLTINYYGDGLF